MRTLMHNLVRMGMLCPSYPGTAMRINIFWLTQSFRYRATRTRVKSRYFIGYMCMYINFVMVSTWCIMLCI